MNCAKKIPTKKNEMKRNPNNNCYKIVEMFKSNLCNAVHITPQRQPSVTFVADRSYLHYLNLVPTE